MKITLPTARDLDTASMIGDAAFVLVSAAGGSMIVARNDYTARGDDYELGVGAQLLRFGIYDPGGLNGLVSLVTEARARNGDGVVVIDGGANVGGYLVPLARCMAGWGTVLGFEPQERLFYALCGNIALNNCDNASAYRAALGRKDALIEFPVPDYHRAGHFSGVNALGQADIGQVMTKTRKTPVKMIDSLELARLDVLKLDLEGMEIEALEGARETIAHCSPAIFAEHIHCGAPRLRRLFDSLGYQSEVYGIDMVAARGPNEIVSRLATANAGTACAR